MRRFLPRLAAGLFGVAAVLAAAPTHAADAPPARVRLAYDAPPACPSREKLIEPIAARIGYAPVDGAAAREIRVSVRKEPNGYRAEIALAHDDAPAPAPAAQRTLTSASCDELVQSAALTIAYYMDPILGPRAPKTSAPAAAAVTSAPLGGETSAWREPDPFDAPPPPRPTVRRAWFFGAAGVATAVGLGPAPMLGPRVGAGWRRGDLSLALEGRADLSLASQTSSGLDVRASLVGASLIPCFRQGWAFGCVEITLGRYEATASGAAVRSSAAFFLLPGVRAGAELAASEKVKVHLFVFGGAPVTPMRLLVSGEPVWQSSALTGGLALALEASP
jgi:hypothetical protein